MAGGGMEDEDLRKAIAASLGDAGDMYQFAGISYEDQILQQVLEASTAKGL